MERIAPLNEDVRARIGRARAWSSSVDGLRTFIFLSRPGQESVSQWADGDGPPARLDGSPSALEVRWYAQVRHAVTDAFEEIDGSGASQQQSLSP